MSEDRDPGIFDLLREIEGIRHEMSARSTLGKVFTAFRIKVEVDAEAYAAKQAERKVDIYVSRNEAILRAAQSENNLHANLHRIQEEKRNRSLPPPRQTYIAPAPAQPALPAPRPPALPPARPSQAVDWQEVEKLALSLIYEAIDDGWLRDDQKWQAAIQGGDPQGGLPPGVTMELVRDLANDMRVAALKNGI